MDRGQVAMTGSAPSVEADPRLKQIYLGVADLA
jgi:ABC-type uncharacterized transport system ATPase subunit